MRRPLSATDEALVALLAAGVMIVAAFTLVFRATAALERGRRREREAAGVGVNEVAVWQEEASKLAGELRRERARREAAEQRPRFVVDQDGVAVDAERSEHRG